jgi:hypothetical protein
MKESKGFMGGLSGMFNCVLALGIFEGNNQIIYCWKRGLTLLGELWKESGILKTNLG